eukprot:12072192-Alexandrium_andersonii.AAC.1
MGDCLSRRPRHPLPGEVHPGRAPGRAPCPRPAFGPALPSTSRRVRGDAVRHVPRQLGGPR